MREYLFRGKRIDNGEWVEGYYFMTPLTEESTGAKSEDGLFFLTGRPRHCIAKDNCVFEVDPETVGQFTGLLDKNGKRIFERDICRDNTGDIVQIVWSKNHSWGCKIIKGCTLSLNLTFPLWQWDNCRENGFRKIEVIGNIHDTPALLGGAE